MCFSVSGPTVWNSNLLKFALKPEEEEEEEDVYHLNSDSSTADVHFVDGQSRICSN